MSLLKITADADHPGIPVNPVESGRSCVRPDAVPLPKIPRLQLLLLAAGLFGLMPLAGMYFVELIQIEHYQYTPFLVVAAMLLIWHRWPRCAWDLETFECLAHSTPGVVAAMMLTTGGLTLGMLAAWIMSPWLGYLGIIVSGAGILWLLTGRGFKAVCGPWLLLLTGLRLPLGLDEELIQWLQHKVAALADHSLDLLGVVHFRQGVLIELPGQLMFVEEACSGIQSLFSMIALAALLIVWEKRPMIWGGLLILGAVAGASVMNLVRVISVVVAADRYRLDLFQEPLHTVLGIAVFLLGLGWLWCCDLWLAFLFGPVTQEEADSRIADLLLKGWNRTFSGQRRYFREPDHPNVESTLPLADWRTWNAGYAGLSSVGVGLLCLANLGNASPDLSIRSSSEGIVTSLQALTAESLPEQLSGTPLTRYEIQHRPQYSNFGQYSNIWTYSDADSGVLASVDYPFTGWHDLCECYTGIGWQVGQVRAVKEDDRTGPRLEVELHKPSGETGFLVFGLLYASGEPFALPKGQEGLELLENRLSFGRQKLQTESVWTAQIQIFTSSYGGIELQQRERLRDSYAQVRSVVAEALKLQK